MATGWQLPVELTGWIAHLSQPLHARLAWRLLPVLTGILFAQGRRTVASWLRAGRLGADYKAYYYFLGSLGRNVKYIAFLLLRRAVTVIEPGERLLFALDDTPTKRYGPQVKGAGIHHNPTPGAGGPEVSLRSCLGDPGVDRATSPLGNDRSAVACAAVRPSQADRSVADAVRRDLPDQAGDGCRVGRMAGAVAAFFGENAVDRRRRRLPALSYNQENAAELWDASADMVGLSRSIV